MTARRRLLSISHSYVVGVNRRLADALARAGWEVTAVAPLEFDGDFGRVRAGRGPADDVASLEAVPVRLGRWIHFMTYGSRLRELLREKWDIVHCWEEPYIVAAAQIARANGRRAPLVFATFQNISKYYPPPFSQLERYAIRRAAGWIAFGQTIEQALTARAGYDSVPHAVIPPGVDLESFRPRAELRAEARHALGWDERARVIGFAGRFVEEKGMRVLTSALEAIEGNWRALLVGSGPLEGELRRWAAPRRDRIAILSAPAHDDMPRWYNAMDVLAVPSLTTHGWREQFGRVIVEAMACGVAVVGSTSGEVPFVIADAGRIVEEGDVPAWSETLTRLVLDDPLRASLGAAGRIRAAEFSWDRVAEQHTQFFKRLIAS
jgi:glycosyltransferase involved in cell wall biosynthesis